MVNYKLAPAMYSHLPQLILATLPLLGVLLYFLYLAATRRNAAYYNPPGDDDYTNNAAVEAQGPLIDMMNMVYVFLAFFLFWLTAAIYVHIYIPKRRKLISSYANEGKIVLGDVKYLPRRGLRYVCTICKRFAPEYAAVTYRHPDPPIPNANTGVSTTEAGGAEPGAANRSARNLDPEKSWLVTKRVRTYQPYSREKVNILVLSGLAKSGQPKSDIDIDYASFTETVHGERDMTWGVFLVMMFWVVFTLLGSLFVVYQMEQLNDPNVDFDYAWKFWLAFVVVVTPLVAVGGNHLRWTMYRRWLIKAGKYIEEGTDADVAVRPSYEDDEPGCDGGVCHATLCAGGDEDDSVMEGEARSSYRQMA